MADLIVMGLDLSISATGLATPYGELGTLRPARKGDRRLTEVRDQIRYHIDPPPRPDLVVIEDLPPTRAKATAVLGMLHGVVRADLIDWGIPYLLVPPATLKVYATGRGNTPKPDLRMEMFKRMGEDVADDNQCDAAWLRLLGYDLAGEARLELPQTHRRALQKLVLPQETASRAV